MKTILAPVDFSSVTPQVVDAAVELAQDCGGTVVLLHVASLPAVVGDYAMPSGSVVDLIAAIEEAADQHLKGLDESLQRRGVDARSIRRTGVAVAEILAEARTLSADYIVIGSHGHTALYDLLVGSTTNAIVKRAPCPVIIVPTLRKAAHVGADLVATAPLEAL